MTGNVTVIRAAEQPLVDSTKSPLSSRWLLTPESFASRTGLSWIRLNGCHARQNSGTGERFYYILSGTVVFRVDGQPQQQAGAGDLVYMPKNCDYTFEGDISYLYITVT